MSLGYDIYYADDVDALIAEIQSRMSTAGWTQVGTSDIYKSGVTDEEGNYAYVQYWNDAGTFRVYAWHQCDEAGETLPVYLSRVTSFAAGCWEIWVFPLWVMAIDAGGPGASNGILAGGLFRPFKYSPMWYAPVFVFGSAGTEYCRWTWYYSLAGRVRWLDGAERYFNMTGEMAGYSSSGALSSDNQSPIKGGIMLYPVFLVDPVDNRDFFGTMYNCWKSHGLNAFTGGTDAYVHNAHESLYINGVLHMTPCDEDKFYYLGGADFLQMETFV